MEITCYPAYGYKKDGAWKIPTRVWVRTSRSLFGHPITHLLMDHSVNFENLIADLVAHNEEGQKVSFTFDAGTASRRVPPRFCRGAGDGSNIPGSLSRPNQRVLPLRIWGP